MRSTSEKARLIKEFIETVRVSGAAVPLRTSDQVEAWLVRLRREMPSAGSATDEDLLRAAITQISGSARVALTGDEREIQEGITAGKELFYQKRFEEAREVLLQAEELAVKLGDDSNNAWAKQYLGRIERDSGNFAEAMRLYEQALELAERIPDSKLLAVLYDQIGTTFRDQGDLDRAEEYYQMALSAHPDSASFANGNLAVVYQLRGQAKRAAELDREARAGYQSEGNLRGEAMSCCNRAQARLSKMDYVGAARLALEAFRAATATGYTQVLLNVEGLFDAICANILGMPDSLSEFKSVLGLKWKPDEWQFRRLLFLNLFMDCVEKELFRDAAETGWMFAKLTRIHNDTELLASLREPLQTVRDGLERIVERTAAGKSQTEAAEDLLAVALCQAALGDPDGALRHAREAEGLFKTGSTAEGLRRLQQLREDLRQGTAAPPESNGGAPPEGVFPPAEAESRLRAAIQAAAAGADVATLDCQYLEALATYPDATHIRLEYATLLDWLGRNAEAVPVLREGLRRFPDDASLAAQLAWALVESGDDGKEIARLCRIAEKDPRALLPLADTTAWFLFRQGRCEEALKVLQPALPLAPRVPVIAYHASAIHAAVGRKEDAKQYLALAIRNDRPFSGREDAEHLARELGV